MSTLPRALVLALFLWSLALPAWAYIDPNAGGVLFQLLAPLFAAVVGAWLVARRWIAETCKRLWRRLTGRPEA